MDYDSVVRILKQFASSNEEVQEVDDMLAIIDDLMTKYSGKIYPIIGKTLKPIFDALNDYAIDRKISNIRKTQMQLNCDLDTAIFITSDLERRIEKFSEKLKADIYSKRGK